MPRSVKSPMTLIGCFAGMIAGVVAYVGLLMSLDRGNEMLLDHWPAFVAVGAAAIAGAIFSRED